MRTRLMGLLRLFIGRIPPVLGNPFADLMGEVVYRSARKSRRYAIGNISHVLGQGVSRRVLKRKVRGVFHNVMRNYYDLCRAPDTSDADIDRYVDFDWEGWNRLVSYLNAGRGVILVTAHFGSFDMMTQVITRRNVPMTVLIARIKPAWLSDFITQLRAARGLILVEVEEEEGSGLNLGALKRSVNVLKEGALLGVVADRNLEPHGMMIPFFGRDTLAAVGVAKMALRTQAVIVPAFCFRMKGNRYSLIFEDPIEPPKGGRSDAEIKDLLLRIFARFEHHISRNPEQWVLLQPIWREA